jgi:ATP-binding cassette subfamily B protein
MTTKGLFGMYRGWWRRASVIAMLAACVAFLEGTVLVLLTQVIVTLLDVDPSAGTQGAVGDWLPGSVSDQLAWGVGAAGVRAVLQAGVGYLRASTVVQYRVDLRRRLYDAWFGADWAIQATTGHAELDNLLTPASKACTRAMLGMLRGLESSIAVFILLGGAFLMAPALCGVLALVGLALFLIQRPLVTAAQRVGGQTAHALRAYGGRLAQVVARAEEVRGFGVQAQVFAWVDAPDQDLTRNRWWSIALRETTPVLFFNFAVLAMVGAAGLVAWMGGAVFASAPVLVVCFRAIRHGQKLARVAQSVKDGIGWHEVFEERLEAYRTQPVHDGEASLLPFDRVVLQGVGFSYPDGTRALSEVSATLCKGDVVGLAGPSGAGKSTLVEVLLRLRIPTQGRVLLGDQDLHALSASSLYRRLRYVPQKPELKEGSAWENLRFFRENLTLDEGRSSWAKVGLEGAFREDMDVGVGAGGSQLSGGQQQRLMFARALIGDADLWVLDEPTSALDVEAEAFMHEQIQALAKTACVLVVAHRPALLQQCDRIWLMEAGRLMDEGGAREMLTRHPHLMGAEKEA